MPQIRQRNRPPANAIPQGRAAEFRAMAALREQGYTVVRSVGAASPVHLIAWEDRDRPLFVRVQRARRPVAGAAEVASRWPAAISRLRAFPRAAGGSAQFWIATGLNGWQVYEVHPGGIAEVQP